MLFVITAANDLSAVFSLPSLCKLIFFQGVSDLSGLHTCTILNPYA